MSAQEKLNAAREALEGLAAEIAAKQAAGEPITTAKAALAIVDGVLSQHSRESEDLWNILSAMRGPDDENYDLKNSVTIPIRRAAFPRTALDGGASTGASFYQNKPGPFNGEAARGHFGVHGRWAASSLKRIGQPVEE